MMLNLHPQDAKCAKKDSQFSPGVLGAMAVKSELFTKKAPCKNARGVAVCMM
jgi:hypothetical protein